MKLGLQVLIVLREIHAWRLGKWRQLLPALDPALEQGPERGGNRALPGWPPKLPPTRRATAPAVSWKARGVAQSPSSRGAFALSAAASASASALSLARASAFAMAIVLGLAGCGYRPAYDAANGVRYDVVVGRYSTASFEAVSSTVAGVRSELGGAEALGDGYPRVVVEVLRVDERSLGARSAGDGTPLARGSEITVVGRAQVLTAPQARASIDTGDMSRTAAYASGRSPTADAAARSRAIRDAARALGKALGRAVLGLPEPSEG